jgi:hypothetical protein
MCTTSFTPASKTTPPNDLGLFRSEELLASFASAGLSAWHSPDGLSDRGLYLARLSVAWALHGGRSDAGRSPAR